MSLLMSFEHAVKRSPLVKESLARARGFLESQLYDLSPVLLARYRFRVKVGRPLNLEEPATFDEKLLWLMLYWRHPLKTKCADKYDMRSYATDRGYRSNLPELLGVYGDSREIEFDTLPDRFVLKCSHGCKFNIICRNKRELDVAETRRKLDRWMKIDYSRVEGEVHYAGMTPRIICEPFLDDLAGDLPCDYKIYCFDGRPHCTMACTGRTTGGSAQFDFYDREWRTKLPYSKSAAHANRSVPKPPAYDEMVAVAAGLSKPFPFVRVDFYSINGKAVLGEMTFTPSACIDTGYTDIAQKELGALITLPPKLV